MSQPLAQIAMRLFLFLLACLAGSAVSGQTVLEDHVYDENIQTVRLYPASLDISTQTSPPVLALNSNTPLLLTFDDIAYEADQYSAKVIHCNADWTPSRLREADYLSQYNEFNVNEYEYGINTRIPYIHYKFTVPRVTKTGNYVLKVYRGRNEANTVITQRFMVFQNQVNLAASIVPPSNTADRQTSQQIEVMVNYANRELLDPLNNTRIVIRQNQRWDHAKYQLKPTFIREDLRQIEYRLFDGSNTFLAGNEFRFIDLRYVRARGRNIAAVRMEEDVVFAEAGVDENRRGQAYLEYLDLNGQYVVMNVERQNHHLESEYVLVTFNLQSPELPQPPYILGALTGWGKKPDAKMTYNKDKKMYEATLFLKQGWYDYQYALKSTNEWDTEPFEGTHFQAENEYEVFFYYRDMGSRYDELIGYTVINPNKRRL